MDEKILITGMFGQHFAKCCREKGCGGWRVARFPASSRNEALGDNTKIRTLGFGQEYLRDILQAVCEDWMGRIQAYG